MAKAQIKFVISMEDFEKHMEDLDVYGTAALLVTNEGKITRVNPNDFFIRKSSKEVVDEINGKAPTQELQDPG